MTKAKTLRIGIATLDQMRDRTIAIARGTHRRAPDEPKVWFRSIESLAKILSEGNREVLAVIAAEHPQSIEELAQLTGRKKSNLAHAAYDGGVRNRAARSRRTRPHRADGEAPGLHCALFARVSD